MGYLVAAYAVLWAISFGLVFSIVLRQRRLHAELEMLQHVVDDTSEPEYIG
jgi:CcmD family protein